MSHAGISRLLRRGDWTGDWTMSPGTWGMSPGERAAVEGVLRALQPKLSVEIGTSSGGSLDAVSAHSEEVHSFDLRRHPSVTADRFPNVTFHVGDSHKLLPRFLEALSSEGKNLDFALVDGDHTSEGVRQDVVDLLSSPCVRETVILLHDTLNQSVRLGLERIDQQNFEKLVFVDLDFVSGRVMSEGPQKDEYWSGLGLLVAGFELADSSWPRAYPAPEVYDVFSRALFESGRSMERLGFRQFVELQQEVETQKRLVALMDGSWSWRVTAPLRGIKGFARRVIRR